MARVGPQRQRGGKKGKRLLDSFHILYNVYKNLTFKKLGVGWRAVVVKGPR